MLGQTLRRRKASNDLAGDIARSSQPTPNLPPDAIDVICAHAGYSAHFGLACSCKRIARIMAAQADETILAATRYVTYTCPGAMFTGYILPNGAHHLRSVLIVWNTCVEVTHYRGRPITYRAGPHCVSAAILPAPPLRACAGPSWEVTSAKRAAVLNDMTRGRIRQSEPFDL